MGIFSRSLAISLALGVLVVTSLLWYGTTFIRLPTGFAARYYAGRSGNGGASYVTVDERVSTATLRRNWPRTDERFAVRWDSYLLLKRSGTYRFSLISDHGTQLYIDDHLVIDNGGDHALRQATAEIPLHRSVHTLRLESSPAREPYTVELLWAPHRTFPLSSLTGSAVSPRELRPLDVALQFGRDGIRAFSVAAWIVLYWSAVIVYVVLPALKLLIRHHAPNGLPLTVIALLALSAGLYLVGLTWGLPGQGWAADEVFPADLLTAVDGSFYREWWSQNPKYPPAHFYLLMLALPPFLVWRWLDPTTFAAAPALDVLFVVFRLVSVAMAVSTVLMVYVCGSYLYRARSALVAAAIAALTLPMVYHAKIATLDVPFVFWFSISLASFVRILVDDSPVDYSLFAVAAALAACTKDQAYGLYVVPLVALLCLAYTRAGGGSPIRTLTAMLGRRRLLLAACLALIVFALVQNLLFNFGGFLFHIRYVTGSAAEPYRMFEPTTAGQWQLWRAVWMLVRVSFGWPAFLLCMLGIALSVWRPQAAHRRLWWVLLPAVSYYVTFLAPIGYAYDRFLLPVFIPLALAAGFGVSRVDEAPRVRRPLLAGVAAVLAYSIAYAVVVDVAMIRDSRYNVEAWMRSNIQPGATIGTIGPADHLPRTSGFSTRYVSPNAEWLRIAPVDYIVVNVDWIGRFRPGLPEHELYKDLWEGRLGYVPVFESRTPIRFAGMQFSDRFQPFGSTGFSTLTKLNPQLIVFGLRR